MKTVDESTPRFKGGEFCEYLSTYVEDRSVAFPKDGGLPISASLPGYDTFPWESDTLTLIGLDNYVIYAKTWEEKQSLAFSHSIILICWPGKYAQDVFLIDDIDAFRHSMGYVLKSEDVIGDQNGRFWCRKS